MFNLFFVFDKEAGKQLEKARKAQSKQQIPDLGQVRKRYERVFNRIYSYIAKMKYAYEEERKGILKNFPGAKKQLPDISRILYHANNKIGKVRNKFK